MAPDETDPRVRPVCGAGTMDREVATGVADALEILPKLHGIVASVLQLIRERYPSMDEIEPRPLSPRVKGSWLRATRAWGWRRRHTPAS
jgi:hypothetical protein